MISLSVQSATMHDPNPGKKRDGRASASILQWLAVLARRAGGAWGGDWMTAIF